jgi:drug/metabolite transporter (DMT)-like permease
VAVFSIGFAILDGLKLPSFTMSNLIVLIYLGLFGTVYTFLMQTAMQRFTTATRTALVFSLEPVFAALFAFILGGEVLTSMGWIGGSLIIAGMIVAEIDWKGLISR